MSKRHLKPASVALHPIYRTLREKLEASDLSVKAIARRAGFDVKTLRNWWRGHSTPRLQDLEAVFNALGYEVTILVTYRDHK